VLSKVSKEIVGEPVDTNRLYDAVNVIISLQQQLISDFRMQMEASQHMSSQGHTLGWS